MKKAIPIVLVIIFAAIFAPAIRAQYTDAQHDLYQKFLDNRTSNPSSAYQAATDYLQQYGTSAPADDQIVSYLRQWVARYEKAARRQALLDQLKAKQVDAAFASAKTVLIDYPDDARLLYDLARTGIAASLEGHTANDEDTVRYAKRVIEILKSGRSFDADQLLSDEARTGISGTLNWGIGQMLQKSAPGDAIDYLMNAARLEGIAKTNPLTYSTLAQIYESLYYEPVAEKFKTDCQTDEQLKTESCMEMKARADLLIDHIMDALARAIAYSNLGELKARYDKYRPSWMNSVTTYYKYRHQDSDAGLKEMIDGIIAKPILERLH